MNAIRLVPHGPHQFFLGQAARRPALFDVLAEGTDPGAGAGFVVVGGGSFGQVANAIRALLDDAASLAAFAAGWGLLIDCSSEGPPFAREHAFHMHLAFERMRLPGHRVVFLHHNARVPADYAAWVRDYPAFAPMRTFSYHYYLQDFVSDEAIARMAAAGEPPAKSAAAGTLPFLCLNHRIKPHRVAVLGHLARRGLLDAGAVSFRLGRYQEGNMDLDEGLQRAAVMFPGLGEDLAAAAALAPRLPLLPDEPPMARHISVDDARHLHDRAFLALVAESEMRPEIERFTEKSLKPLLNGTPFVVAGNHRTLAALRGLGFQGFAPLIDEAYDEIADPADRLAACLAEFDRLMALGPAGLERLTRDLGAICAFNRRHFAHGLRTQCEATVDALAETLRAALAG